MAKHGTPTVAELCQELGVKPHTLERSTRREHREWRKHFLGFLGSCGPEVPISSQSRGARRAQNRRSRRGSSGDLGPVLFQGEDFELFEASDEDWEFG